MTTTINSLNAATLRSFFDMAMDYDTYMTTDEDKASNWKTIHEQVELTDEQRRLIGGFKREMKVLCISGIWCGDCVQQGPLVQRIAEANDCIELRWIDRDQALELAEHLKINAGLRVPVVIFMAEDFEPVSVFGDRTLTRYRAMAGRQLAGACPLPGAPVPDDELRGTMQDWLNEFERVQLLLRLSGRLREIHGD